MYCFVKVIILYVILSPSCSSRASSGDRPRDGAGRGACGRGSSPRTREASGRRPAPLRGSAFNGWTRGGNGRFARMGMGLKAHPADLRKHGPGDTNRRQRSAVKRSLCDRKQRGHASQACRVAAPATRRASQALAFPGAPLPSLGNGLGNDGAPGAAKNTGGGAFATFRHSGALALWRANPESITPVCEYGFRSRREERRPE